MRTTWLCVLMFASAACVAQGDDHVGSVESAIDVAPPPPGMDCPPGSEYTSYSCCLEIVHDPAYCAAMNPPQAGPMGPFDLGEGAPAQSEGTIPVDDSTPPPTFPPTPPDDAVTCVQPGGCPH